MPKRKLIETVMPVAVINTEAEREKTARNGMPSAVHIWWSRRSMAAARCTLFASLVDDPSEHPERFPTIGKQKKERDRLVNIVERLAVVENTSDEKLLNTAYKEIIRYFDGSLPIVFDPFVGGGSIPVEAHRLGLNTVSSDLNAVAVIMTTIVSDIPARFSGNTPVHPSDNPINMHQSGVNGFSEDVRYYGEWMQQEAVHRIGHLYPQVKQPKSKEETEVLAWIWARTVKCPSPSCRCNIPLSSSYDLARKKGSEAWVEPEVENGTVQFHIHQKAREEENVKPKVAQTAVFKCPSCGEVTTDSYVKECGRNHQIHSQLIAVVADNGKKRLFLEPDINQIKAAQVVPPKDIPHGKLPNNPRRFSPPSFGLSDYADLFTPRQLTYITTMMQLAKEVQHIVEEQAIKSGLADDHVPFIEGGHGALAYAQAIRITLAVTISKLLDRCSSVCSWDASGSGSLRNVFSRSAMPMIWDYAESNPFSSASGSFLNTLGRTCEAISQLPIYAEGKTIQADATLPNNIHNALISTDLPYFDRAGYADLSDFFYVWLRFGLGDICPDMFKPEVSPKKEELTSFLYRWQGDRQQANAFYAEGFRLACNSMYNSISEEYPSSLAIIYQHDSSHHQTDEKMTEWEIIMAGICDAQIMVTASWPLGRRKGESIQLAEARGIPITLVVRKRPPDAQDTTRRNFVSALKRELPPIITAMKEIVGLEDLRASVIGKAWNIFTRYRRVLDADGSAMKPYQASRIIEEEIDLNILPEYGEGEQTNKQEEKDHG